MYQNSSANKTSTKILHNEPHDHRWSDTFHSKLMTEHYIRGGSRICLRRTPRGIGGERGISPLNLKAYLSVFIQKKGQKLRI